MSGHRDAVGDLHHADVDAVLRSDQHVRVRRAQTPKDHLLEQLRGRLARPLLAHRAALSRRAEPSHDVDERTRRRDGIGRGRDGRDHGDARRPGLEHLGVAFEVEDPADAHHRQRRGLEPPPRALRARAALGLRLRRRRPHRHAQVVRARAFRRDGLVLVADAHAEHAAGTQPPPGVVGIVAPAPRARPAASLSSATSSRSFTTNSTPASRHARDELGGDRRQRVVVQLGRAQLHRGGAPRDRRRGDGSVVTIGAERRRTSRRRPPAFADRPSRLPPPVLPGSGPAGRRRHRAGLSARSPRAPRWFRRSIGGAHPSAVDAGPSDRPFPAELLPVARRHGERDVGADRITPIATSAAALHHGAPEPGQNARARNGASLVAIAPEACIHARLPGSARRYDA